MSISSYNDLKQKVLDWTARQDLLTQVDDFISLAEAFLQTEFRNKKMLKTFSITTVNGSNNYALPSDYLGAQQVSISGTSPYLQKVENTWIDVNYSSDIISRPLFWADDVPNNEIRFAPTPDGEYTITLTYLGSITPLNDNNPTNWLLTNYPYIYLHACLHFAYMYLQNRDDATYHQNLLTPMLENLKEQMRRSNLQLGSQSMQMRVNLRQIV